MQKDHLRSILERDRVWSAYALADLEPGLYEESHWYVAAHSLVMIYHGLRPAVLFAFGDPQTLAGLYNQIPIGRYAFSLKQEALQALEPWAQIKKKTPMERMLLMPERFPPGLGEGAIRLKAADLRSVEALFAQEPDQPDAFSAYQLRGGVFYGAKKDGMLVAVAGTHVLSNSSSVACVGNIFTHPAHRRQGWAQIVTAAVVQALLALGIETIVLNVAQKNHAARNLYQKLGFVPACKFYEGLANRSERT